MNKKRLVIASVLKPVDDTRMYEKFSLSMAKTNKYEINIIGFSAKKCPVHPNINFYPLFSFQRLSVKRFFAPFRFFGALLKIKPELVIITTYELLLPALFYRWTNKSKIIYDIQENYAKNVTNNHGLPAVIKFIWVKLISFIERTTSQWVAHFILAEKGYEKELNFIGEKYTIIENKTLLADKQRKPRKKHAGLRFIYSGTITKNYGIYQAIQLYMDIREYFQNCSLHIIGHFPYKEDYLRIQNMAEKYADIILEGSLAPIAHTKIMKAIGKADVGIVSHQPVPSIANCFPTRIYEYMAHRLPIILQDHPLWTSYCKKWNSAITVDYNNYDAENIVSQLRSKTFYKHGVPADVFWENQEEAKLLQLIHEITKIN